jgi:hypothetical protein
VEFGDSNVNNAELHDFASLRVSAIPANPLLVVRSQDPEAAVHAIILKFSLLRFDALWFLIAFVSPLRLLRTWS